MKIQKLITPVIIIMIIAAIVKIFLLPATSKKPQLSEIKDQVYTLMSDLYCEGKEVEIDLKKAEIDEYTEGHPKMEIKGWPVRISAEVICDQGDSKYTEKFSLDNPAFFVRATAFGYKVFLPEKFLEFKDQLAEEMKSALDK